LPVVAQVWERLARGSSRIQGRGHVGAKATALRSRARISAVADAAGRRNGKKRQGGLGGGRWQRRSRRYFWGQPGSLPHPHDHAEVLRLQAGRQSQQVLREVANQRWRRVPQLLQAPQQRCQVAPLKSSRALRHLWHECKPHVARTPEKRSARIVMNNAPHASGACCAAAGRRILPGQNSVHMLPQPCKVA
jgi:hypothetical protein